MLENCYIANSHIGLKAYSFFTMTRHINDIIPLSIHLRLLLVLSLAFVAFTIIGTLSHECGHYFAAKYFGYDAQIHYQYVTYKNESFNDYILDMNNIYGEQIKNKADFPGKEKYFETIRQQRIQILWITIWGPLQTTITSVIGILFLIYKRASFIKLNRVNFWGWLSSLLALFSLRPSANLVVGLFNQIRSGFTSTFREDETNISFLLNLPSWSLAVTSGLLGFLVLFYVIRWLPTQLRLTFILAGLMGGCLGYYVWLIKLGPIIMP